MADEKEVNFDDLKIDGDVATWEMRLEGTIKGTYVGVFKFRCYLTPLQNIAAGREQRELLGQNMAMATEHDAFMAYALTQLKQRIIAAPPFWSSSNPSSALQGDIPDEDIIERIFDAAVRAELKYKGDKKKQKEDALARANKMVEAIKEKERKDLEEAQKAHEDDQSS